MTAGSPRNKFPLSRNYSYCLVFSSCFFLIPGYYALSSGLYWYLATSTLTTIVSANYWRYAIPGLRRSIDMIVAKLSFIIYFTTGMIYIRDPSILYTAWLMCGGIVMCYYLSNKMWGKDSDSWIYYHMMFHILVAFEQCLVLVVLFRRL